MSYLLKNVTIIDKESSYHNKIVDVFYKNGSIQKIGKNLKEKAEKIIDAKNKYLSISWIDTFADFSVPGFEHREDMESGIKAAIKGGFGKVMLVPNTEPTISTATDVKSLKIISHNQNVSIFPIGSISKKIEGKELAEMLDMNQSGAIAFSDGWKPVQNEQLLLKSLEFVKIFDGVLIQIPILENIVTDGLMNEGITSLKLGINPQPVIAEELKIYIDISLAKYTDSRLHIAGVSTKKGLDLIKNAKKERIKITCSVTPYHLLWNDEQMMGYDAQYKVNPPLRTEEDRKAMIKGLKDGVIDCIASFHKAHDWDEKEKELQYASFGMAAMEVAWPMLNKAIPDLSVEKWNELLVENPSRIFRIEKTNIEEGSKATLTLFDKEEKWINNPNDFQSKAYNIPLKNAELIGKSQLIF